ncbi:hypothetical protein SAMN04488134_10323 [Amphibacillus marinus]|uniref:Uncharacterized protein n=1 Tax=Amphibacillus marinus TaxID=872970 RepID=A0A1H8L0L5_9BACI|nr:hypothetical protein SAMN04488134_10323 [Amphibacillus marinus]
MIHTFKQMFELHYQEVQDLQRRHNIKYTQLNNYFNGVFPGDLALCPFQGIFYSFRFAICMKLSIPHFQPYPAMKGCFPYNIHVLNLQNPPLLLLFL